MHAFKMKRQCHKGKAQWPAGHAPLADNLEKQVTEAELPLPDRKLLKQEQHNCCRLGCQPALLGDQQAFCGESEVVTSCESYRISSD